MSSTEEQASDGCASCGVKEDVDDVKLKKCTGCDGLVKYCSVGCQKNHRPQHKKACKKRAAEIRDDRLFRQPEESHIGECPICFLPLPLDATKYTMKSCCSKYICLGCFYAHMKRQEEESQEPSCPFCREPQPKSKEEAEKANRKRAEANDPFAVNYEAYICYENGDYEGAFQHWKKAAQLGDINAHHQVSCLYHDGMGIEMDEKRKCTIWKRPLLVVMRTRDTILEIMRRLMATSREQLSILSSLSISDLIRHWKSQRSFMPGTVLI